jgi:hypothetical protein
MQSIDQAKKEMEKHIKTGADEVQKSAKDWYGYIEKHPLQSMLFGTVIYFALKGLLKE